MTYVGKVGELVLRRTCYNHPNFRGHMHAPAFKASTSRDWKIVAGGGNTRYEKNYVISSIVQSLL
jgi:hypothetical protein